MIITSDFLFLCCMLIGSCNLQQRRLKTSSGVLPSKNWALCK